MNMFFCKRTTKHELNWINLFNNRFVLVIILLTTNVHANSRYAEVYSHCSSHETCEQCLKASNCSWLFGEQKCNDAESNFSDYLVVYSAETCPRFSTASSREQQENVSDLSITITISNQTESVQTYLANSSISCDVENTVSRASLSADGNRITCKSNIKRSDVDKKKAIFYFAVTVNGVHVRFDDPKDHYLTANFLGCDDTPCEETFWVDESRKYYCKWCMDNDCGVADERRNGKCDVRTVKDNAIVTESVSNVEIKGTDVAIADFTPALALPVETTSVTIFIKNTLILSNICKTIIVTVAGRSCDRPTKVQDNEIACTVPKGTQINDVAEGPVEVTYSSSTRNYTVKSRKNFTFFNPTLEGFEPTCGSVDGNTGLRVTGTFFNATRNVQVSVGDIDCEIREFDHNHFICATGKSDRAQVISPKIKFNNKLVKRFKASFTYADVPTVEPQQNLSGIASGGTRIRILGSFGCVKTPRMNVHRGGQDVFENCELAADERKIVCVTPKLEHKWDQVFPTDVSFRLHMTFDGRLLKTQEFQYRLYPDPIFVDFEVNGTTIRINGLFLNMGYRPEDVSVRVRNFNDTCVVLFVDSGYIVCQVPSSLSVDSVQELVVAVGQSLKAVIMKKLNPTNSRQFQMATVLSGISIVSVFVALVFGLLFCYKIILTNSKQQTEKRYMEELRNITAGMEDKKF